VSDTLAVSDTVANSSQDTVENNELIIMGLFSVSDTVAHSSCVKTSR